MALLHPPPVAAANTALLLDFDGTLVEFAATPDAVQVDAALRELLLHLQARLGGALAIISGRSIESLDALLAPLRLPLAGLHGLERRTAAGRTLPPPACGDWLGVARDTLRQQAARHAGLLLEEKSHGLALHWRRAPQHADEARRVALQLHRSLRPAPLLVEGHAVIELREPGPGKDAALDAFLCEPPFRGRLPVYVGDDVTDLPALQRALALGGVAIHVGTEAAHYREPLPPAMHRLPDPRAVRDWLGSLLPQARQAR